MNDSKKLAKLWGCSEGDIRRVVVTMFLDFLDENKEFPLKLEITESQLKSKLFEDGKIKNKETLRLI